ncbi:MAG: MraY family glycosyltransferase [Chitinivibrionales bacterium]|nr:MraY family glycosyltransferase [Chitinivibrionales bacterium]
MGSIILQSVVFFFLSALLVFDFIWVLLKTPLVYFFKDKPGVRKIHQRTIPRAGGLCIAGSFLLVLCLWNYCAPENLPHLSPSLYELCLFVTLCIVAVGFFDDTVSFIIVNKAKFLLEIFIAAEIVFFFKIQFPEVNLFGFTITNKALLAGMSIFWIVAVANAMNIIDGIDGLAGMVALIAFSTVGILMVQAHAAGLVIICIFLCGGIVGFLFHNVSPARVFLGDTGSLFLGMLLALLLILLVSSSPIKFSVSTALLIAGFPLLDVSVAMGRRAVRSRLAGRGWLQSLRAMSVADSEHIHHRLVYRGLNHTQATLIISILYTSMCATAVLIYFYSESKYYLVSYMGVVVVCFLYELNFFDRFLGFARRRLHRKNRFRLYRIGVVDADSVLHHALINYRQRIFSIEFISRQEIETGPLHPREPLQPVINVDQQFLMSTDWGGDTRQFSKPAFVSHDSAGIMGAVADGGAMYRDFTAEGTAMAYSVLLINCRKGEENDQKLALGRRLLNEKSYTIIIATEDVPEGAFAKGSSQRQIFFLKKPFYVPVLFSDLYRLTERSIDTGELVTIVKDLEVLRTFKG